MESVAALRELFVTQSEPQRLSETRGRPAYLTTSQLMARTGLSLATVHRYVKKGRLPSLQPGGKGAKLLFPPDAVEIAAAAAAEKAGRELGVYSHPSRMPAGHTTSPNDMPSTKLPGPRPRWQQS